jgi:hypothetical protein
MTAFRHLFVNISSVETTKACSRGSKAGREKQFEAHVGGFDWADPAFAGMGRGDRD